MLNVATEILVASRKYFDWAAYFLLSYLNKLIWVTTCAGETQNDFHMFWVPTDTVYCLLSNSSVCTPTVEYSIGGAYNEMIGAQVKQHSSLRATAETHGLQTFETRGSCQ